MRFHWLFACAAILIGGNVLAEDTSPFFDFQSPLDPSTFESRRESSSNENLYKNGDARSMKSGETLVLGELEGPGVVTHIWSTVGSYDPFYPRNLVIRMYWDGAENPSVEVPIGDFFGVGQGAQKDFISAPVATSSNGRSRNCFWRMPFRKSAKITVTNESTEYDTDSFYYYLDWQKVDEIPEEVPYFHARYRQANPAQPGDYTILDTTGTGHYVGTVYSVQQVETGWFGEGDDRFYIDGEETPSLRGTGTEDYFGDAWGFREFAAPFHGVSLFEGYFPGDRVTAYRWHIPDPVAFEKSLRVIIEHRGSVFTDGARNLGQFTERPDWIGSVAYWYQNPPRGIEERIAPASERVAPYVVLPAADLAISATPILVLKDGATANFMPASGDAEIDFKFEVEKAGRYQVTALLWYSVFGGVYQASLDGVPLGGPTDFCHSGHDAIWTGYDLHDLEAGEHTLKFKGQGASPKKRTMAAPLHAFGMTYLILLRLEDLEGYHEALERKLGGG